MQRWVITETAIATIRDIFVAHGSSLRCEKYKAPIYPSAKANAITNLAPWDINIPSAIPTITDPTIIAIVTALSFSVTLILFEIWRHVFLLYLYYVKTYQILYGVMATVPLFLIWLYFFWVIVICIFLHDSG